MKTLDNHNPGLRVLQSYNDNIVAYFRVCDTKMITGPDTFRIIEHVTKYGMSDTCEKCLHIKPAKRIFTVEMETNSKSYETGPVYISPTVHTTFKCASEDLLERHNFDMLEALGISRQA